MKAFKSIFTGPVSTRKPKTKRSTSQSRYSTKHKKISPKKKTVEKKVVAAAKDLVKKKRLLKNTTKKKLVPKKTVSKVSAKEKKPSLEFYVGEITHYFQKISVVVVKVAEHPILVGDLIHIKGSSADFMQKVVSLQVESKDVRFARKGELVGLQVTQPAKPGDKVYKIKK